MLDLVLSRPSATASTSTPGLDRCERAVALLGEDPARPIADIAAAVGRLARAPGPGVHAHRRALSPRRLARLLRVERLLEAIDVAGGAAWADLAADLGWADQSHMIRDVKRHTGVVAVGLPRGPTGVRALAAPGDEAARFVPEPM